MMKKIFIASLLLLLSFNNTLRSNAISNDTADWTWMHNTHYNEIARTTNRNKKTLVIENDKVQPFTQLIFSWNALRPEQGHFSFYVQVRNAITKKWGKWHHMSDWGAHMQQSYMSKSDGFSTFVHVRLEIDDKKYADAFRIKIAPHKGASLSSLYNLSVTLSDFNLFKLEQLKFIDNGYQSVCIEGLPLIAQFALDHEDKSRICSPTSCTMLIHYLTGITQDPVDFAVQSFDSGLSAYGSWPYNIAHAFECCDGKINFAARRMNSFADLHQRLLEGMPVIVSVRGNLPGALKPFPHGHLMVVVGWDADTRSVLCHDPAAEQDEQVFKRYPLTDFLRAWEASHRLSYVVL